MWRIILSSVTLLLLLIPASQATDPFPYTWVVKKKTEWELLHGYLGGAAIVVENQPAGKKERLWLSDMIAPAEFQKYVGNSTAGPIWERDAFWYFITLENKPHLGIRLGWGSRILLDVEGFSSVDPTKHQATLEVFEKKLILERLQQAVSLMKNKDATLYTKGVYYQTVMHHAVSFQMTEAIPFLKELEQSQQENSFQTEMEMKSTKDEFTSTSHSVLNTRRAAQFSLRRLGQVPLGLPALKMLRTGQYKLPALPVGNKAELIRQVSQGMIAGQVLELIGPPDFIDHINYIDPDRPIQVHWRYDVDGGKPATWFIIILSNRVYQVQEFTPPFWLMVDKLTQHEGHPVFKADGELECSSDLERISLFYLGRRSLTTGLVLAATLLVIVVCAVLMRRKHLQRLAARK